MLVRFLSKSVLVGFIAGLDVEIVTSQIKTTMDVSLDADGWLREVVALIRAVPDASWTSVAVGVGTIALVRVTHRLGFSAAGGARRAGGGEDDERGQAGVDPDDRRQPSCGRVPHVERQAERGERDAGEQLRAQRCAGRRP